MPSLDIYEKTSLKIHPDGQARPSDDLTPLAATYYYIFRFDLDLRRQLADAVVEQWTNKKEPRWRLRLLKSMNDSLFRPCPANGRHEFSLPLDR
jgi:hypothetical protein